MRSQRRGRRVTWPRGNCEVTVSTTQRLYSQIMNNELDAEADALAGSSGTKFDMILANSPFGKEGGYTIFGDAGQISTVKQE